jgi:hypothetical protein
MASVFDGDFFPIAGAFFCGPTDGMIGNICVGAVASCATGCMVMGMSGFFRAMRVKSHLAISFEAVPPNSLQVHRINQPTLSA